MISPARNQGDDRYPAAIRGLHWLVVILLVAQYTIAWTMPEVHRGTAPTGLISWHLSVGVALWLIMLVRLIIRIGSHVPPAPSDLPPSLRLLARVTHSLLYGGILVLPVLGYLNASARGWDVWLFGALKLPQLVPTGTRWAMKLGDVHVTLATVLLGVVALHVAGALYHGLVRRDGTIHRISPA